jgi:hypothetical protein
LNRFSLITVFAIFHFLACKPSEEGKVLAEAFGNKLFESEIQDLLQGDLSEEDSVFIVKEYINSWLLQQAIMNKAGSVLSQEEQDKSRELESYRRDLIMYEVLNKLAAQRIDSNFSDDELLEYYNRNIDEFELAENIVKIMFFRLPSSEEDLDTRWYGFQRDDSETISDLESLALKSGSAYTDTSSWIFFDDILKEIPINTYNQEHFLNNNKFIRIVEGNSIYFVKIHDFRIKSGNSPFELEKERIKKILFVIKQKETLNQIETELVQNAYKENKIVIH